MKDEYGREIPEEKRELVGELQLILDEVGSHNYGKATARQFAKGGKFNRNRRPRYAVR